MASVQLLHPVMAATVNEPLTTCLDGKTVKVSGRLWTDLKRDSSNSGTNFNNSTSKRDVDLKITRGDGKSLTFKSGYEYRYDETNNNLTKVRALSTARQDLGLYWVCGFIADRGVLGSDPKTLFSIQVASLPQGYASAQVVRPPNYKLSFVNNVILYTNDVNGTPSKEGDSMYKNQIGGAGNNASSNGCNSRQVIDPASGLSSMHRCDFLLSPGQTPTTSIGGRVASGTSYFQTGSPCASGITSNISIKSERYDANGNVEATGKVLVDQCNPDPYFSTGLVAPAKRKLTLMSVPTGYSCSDWAYSLYDTSTSSWIDWKSKSNGVFNPADCSLTLTTNVISAPYTNNHNIWFILTKNTTSPSPSVSPTLPPDACNIVPTDIQMIIDRSSSMYENSVTNPQGVTKTKLDWAKVAANKFVDEFSHTVAASKGNVRIGVTSFMGTMSGTTSTSKTPTSDFAQVKTWINSIPANSSGTCISCGEKAAQSSLTQAGQNNGRTTRKVTLLLSDGRANRMITNGDLNGDGSVNETDAGYEAINLANSSRSSSNYLNYVVGFGSSSSPARTWVLKGDHDASSKYPDTGIANEPASTYYRYDQDAFDWTTLFDNTQDSICQNSSLRAQ